MSAITKIYLIRHAEAEGNLYRIAHGHYNGLITDYRGRQQIAALADRFRDIPVDAVYSSDLIRARTTAQAVYLPKGLALHLEPAFREVHMGVWEGRTWHELNTQWPEQMRNFSVRLDRWQVPGAETAQQVLDRFIPALYRVARENEGKTVAVFSHGAAIRMVLGTLQGLPLSQVGQTPHGDNTAVSLLEYDGEKLRVVWCNDNSHLTERGISTFAKQSWWRDKRTIESGEYYQPLTEELRRRFGVPAGGESLSVWFGDEPVGALQLLPEKEPGVGWIGWYWIDPAWRGRWLGMPPMGQAITYYRDRGVYCLRLSCPDAQLAGFFEKLGFERTEGDVMQKDTTQRLPANEVLA